mmetsp:Transcript_26161/g.37182  ORF Transcript_26161/g.37182 Transcript_26161/m.37182 type:complete len:119 (-) Transcript_26161:432-788(-)
MATGGYTFTADSTLFNGCKTMGIFHSSELENDLHILFSPLNFPVILVITPGALCPTLRLKPIRFIFPFDLFLLVFVSICVARARVDPRLQSISYLVRYLNPVGALRPGGSKIERNKDN